MASEGASHPLGIAHSVSAPDGEVAESTVKPLIGMAGEGPATADLGMFSMLSAEDRTPEEAEPYQLRPMESAGRRTSRRKPRSRPLATTAAGAGAAAAIGAVALAIHFMSGPDRATEVLPDNSTSAPDLIRPSDDTSGGTAAGATPATSRSAGPSVSSGAAATATPVAAGSSMPAAPRSATVSASTSGSVPDSKGSARVLKSGDTGSQVVELQDRLKQLGLYSQNADGMYDADVKAAVSLYQARYHVHGDAEGTYGPNTRRSLESETSVT